MRYYKIIRMALILFIHSVKHLLTQDIKKNDEIRADISWTISRKPENEKT